MTKKEKIALNQKLGRVWMELRALSNLDRKNIRTGPDWENIIAKHREVIESNEELTAALLEKYPTKLEEVKNLRYTTDIEKTVKCLNAIQPSEPV
ncbi:MAG: hypothetical protein ACI9GM_000991 [Salibacteraceae bacterium]|jgi:hypothetical protein